MPRARMVQEDHLLQMPRIKLAVVRKLQHHLGKAMWIAGQIQAETVGLESTGCASCRGFWPTPFQAGTAKRDQVRVQPGMAGAGFIARFSRFASHQATQARARAAVLSTHLARSGDCKASSATGVSVQASTTASAPFFNSA